MRLKNIIVMNKVNFSNKVLKLGVQSLRRYYKGGNLDFILDDLHNLEQGATVADLLFNYFRNKAFIDYCIDRFTAVDPGRKKSTPAKFKRIIAIALTQAKYQSGIEEYAAVDVAVEFTKKKYGKTISGFINAVLRRILAEDFYELKASAPDYVRLNMPESVFKRWLKEFGKEEVANFADIFAVKPSLSFRLIANIADAELTGKGFMKIEMPAWAEGYRFYETGEPRAVFAENWLEKGDIYIQDLSTLSPCLFVQTSGNDVVYDLCASPGGKSVVLSERMQSGLLVAADVSVKRQKRTVENLKKTGKTNYVTIVSSATFPALRKKSADFVLLDVPCSNTGVCRRRPDVLWNFSQKKLSELITLQAEILRQGAELVKEGGGLIYSTCSIEKQENQEQVASFLGKHPEFTIENERLLFPCKTHDGGYAAFLRRAK